MSTREGKRIFLDHRDSVVPDTNHLVKITLANGEAFEKLEPRRLFPVSRTESYIILLDENENEVAMIRELKDLDPKSQSVVAYSMSAYYLVPNITAILFVSEKYGTLHWRVETNRGIKEFDIRNRNHDIRIYDDRCVRIRDSDDNRYVIPDYHKLDHHSQKYLIGDL